MSELCKQILHLGRSKKYDELQNLVLSTKLDQLQSTIVEHLNSGQGNALWNFLLMSLTNVDKNDKKRFEIIITALQQMNRTEFKIKQTVEIVTRLNVELSKMSNKYLIQMTEYCIDSIRMGDAKCVAWKDLLPALVQIITATPEITTNGVQMTGDEFRHECVRNLLTMKWPTPILTPLITMFREMSLTKDEQLIVLDKICYELHNLHPDTLPSLSHQIFTMCKTPAMLIKPILCFEKYFFKNYYKQLWEDMSSVSTVSSINSIDSFSPDELRNAEDTITFYLSKTTEFCISETELVTFLRCLTSTPRYILNPFVIGALLSMSNVNQSADETKISTSPVLSFLRNVVRNNEIEREMCQQSKWCRETLDRPVIDLEMIFKVLIENSQKGNDVVTKGIIYFAFMLLKTPKHLQLHELAINFILKFIRDRYKFGKGVIKKLVEFLFADQEAIQYSECLTRISSVNNVAISECPDIIQHILASFLLIPGHCAMKMMCILLPLIKKSIKIRDMLIEILKESIYQRETTTRQFGVYGFCLILRQLNNNNAQRIVPGRNTVGCMQGFTQLTISGYSLMSQNTFENNPQRNFDMMTIEIIGLLRKIFQQSYAIKETLYDGLTKAIHYNGKLTPHIIEFLDWHFRGFFEIDTINFRIKFDLIVQKRIDGLEIWDQLGKLIYLMADCVIVCEQQELSYNTYSMKKLFANLIDGMSTVSLVNLGLLEIFDQRMNIIGCQFLNCLEALMSYSIWITTQDNDQLQNTKKLFEHHENITQSLQEACNNSKKKKLKKVEKINDNTITTTSQLPSITGHSTQCEFCPENIWTLITLKRFVQLIFYKEVAFATAAQTESIRTNRNFMQYILTALCAKLKNLLKQNNIVELRNSATMFKQFCEIALIIYDKCIKQLPAIAEDYGQVLAEICAQCFHQCLIVQFNVYERKLMEFLKFITFEVLTTAQLTYKIVLVLQDIIVQFLDKKNDNIDELVVVLFQCLEYLLKNIPGQDMESVKCSEWLLSICQTKEIQSDRLTIIHKLLFAEQIKTNIGNFFETIAVHIKKAFGSFNKEKDLQLPHFEMKSINLSTAYSCFVILCQTIKTQIEHVEYFIQKAKSFFAKIRIAGKASSESCVHAMKMIEMNICKHLIYIANTLHHLTNSRLPFGQCLDFMEKIVIQYYVCMTNLTKHLTLRHAIIPFSPRESSFEQLLQVAGHPLATRCYELITHIEEEIFKQDKKQQTSTDQNNKVRTKNRKAEKAKVLKETKLLPKLILRIENFNKFVIFLSKRTSSELSGYLHIGKVRDFRILSEPLRECLNQTLQACESIEIDDSKLNDDDDHLHENNIGSSSTQSINDAEISHILSSLSNKTVESELSSTSSIHDLPNTDVTNIKLAMNNLAKINEKSKRKRSAAVTNATTYDGIVNDKRTKKTDAPVRKSGRNK